ncbi:MAG: hypothetical protein ACXADW_24630 [Candidatus Hodarchaeales archaeon]
MSVRKQKTTSDSPMPATGAGLIRFYSESDSPGLKMGPYWTVAIAIALKVGNRAKKNSNIANNDRETRSNYDGNPWKQRYSPRDY